MGTRLTEGTCHALTLLNSCTPPSVPPPLATVTADPDRTLYNGEGVTLTCDITLDPAVDSDVAVTASWTGPDGAITTGVMDMTGSVPYQSTLTLSSLMTTDTGDYKCTASAVPENLLFVIASGESSATHNVTVGKCIMVNIYTSP